MVGEKFVGVEVRWAVDWICKFGEGREGTACVTGIDCTGDCDGDCTEDCTGDCSGDCNGDCTGDCNGIWTANK